jgi:hypothetical protein
VVSHQGLEFQTSEAPRLGSLESHHGRRPKGIPANQRLLSEGLTGTENIESDDVARWGGNSDRDRPHFNQVDAVPGLAFVEDEAASWEALAGAASQERALVRFGQRV